MSDNFLEPADDEQVVVATPEEQLPGLVGYIKEKFEVGLEHIFKRSKMRISQILNLYI